MQASSLIFAEQLRDGWDNARCLRHTALQSCWDQACQKLSLLRVSWGFGQINNSLSFSFLTSKMGFLWKLFHSFFEQIFIESLLQAIYHSGYGNTAMIKLGKKEKEKKKKNPSQPHSPQLNTWFLFIQHPHNKDGTANPRLLSFCYHESNIFSL